jgi:hypothetical protein
MKISNVQGMSRFDRKGKGNLQEYQYFRPLLICGSCGHGEYEVGSIEYDFESILMGLPMH